MKPNIPTTTTSKSDSDAFWRSAKILLGYKKKISLAMSGALLSAGCFGAGIGMLLLVFKLLLRDKTTVHELIQNEMMTPGSAQWLQELGRQLIQVVPADPFYAFTSVMGVILVLTLVGSLGRYIHELLTITVVQHAVLVLRGRLYRKLINAPVSTFFIKGTSDYLGTVVFDTNLLARAYNAIVGRTVEQVLKGLAAISLAFWLDFWLACIAVLGGIPIGILMRKLGKRIRRASKRALQQRGKLMGTAHQAMQGLTTVKYHNAQGYERRRFYQVNRTMFKQEMTIRSVRAMTSPLVETIGLLGVMVVATIAAWYIFERGISPERFMTVLAALGGAANSLKPIAKLNHTINEGRAAAQRLDNVLELASEPMGGDGEVNVPALPKHHQSITFSRVTYTYPSEHVQGNTGAMAGGGAGGAGGDGRAGGITGGGGVEPALKDVSLEISFGQSVAIVGGNGSGKSTLLSLLPRLLMPDSGHIKIDGQDIAQVNLRSLRDQIAVVSQQTVLFQGSIADNIAYGRRYESLQNIIDAAKAAHAHGFISDLPQGYQTKLGEQGIGLSGGQRQRIAIARAILRNPAILILDEATSQIDAHSEKQINQAMAQIKRGRTLLTIAHRLSTVINSDTIIVMDQGKIVDQGTHEQLLKRCEQYQTLTHSQLHNGAAGLS